MNIPSQESIWYITEYDDDYKKLQFLKLLMDRYHLRIDQKNAFWHRWHPEHALHIINMETMFIWILLEAERLNDIFLANTTSFREQFMTQFVIDVANRLSILRRAGRSTFGQGIVDMNADMMLDLIYYQYTMGRHDKIAELAQILVCPVFDFDARRAMRRNRNKNWSNPFMFEMYIYFNRIKRA